MAEQYPLRITQASLNQTALDWPRNMQNIYDAIDYAVAVGSDVLALEELALTGYEVNDDFQRTDNKRIMASLEDIAAYAAELDSNLLISIGHPYRVQKRYVTRVQYGAQFESVKEPVYDRLNLPFNVQSLLMGGKILGMTAKANLYNDGRGYEKRYFNEWSHIAANHLGGKFGTIDIELANGQHVPFGRPIIHVKQEDGAAFNIAHVICEEKWVATKYDGHPHDDSRYKTDNIVPYIGRYIGADDGLMLIIANASPPSANKIDMHHHLDKLASNHADLVIDTDGLGSSGSTFAQFGHRVVAQQGQILASGHRMSFERAAFTTIDAKMTPAPDYTADKAHNVVERAAADKAGKVIPISKGQLLAGWDNANNPNREYEEAIRYTAFWLFDYMRKAGSRGIMEALSGGADSAFNCVVVQAMVHLGVHELGAEKFCTELKLKNAEEIVALEKIEGAEAACSAIMGKMLSAVYMGTNNSSDDTLNAARFLIEGDENTKGIGGKFIYRNVQDLLDFYGVLFALEDTTKLEGGRREEIIRDVAAHLNINPASKTRAEIDDLAAELMHKYPEIQGLTTAADGVAYENIQARGRQVLVMLYANKEGKLAIANPNLDEARNAYATFGGDLHSGTINLNAHLPKSYQLKLMHYLYEHGLQDVLPPVRALHHVLKNKPSAELQPKGLDGEVVQTDEDSLQRSFEQMNFISSAMIHFKVNDGYGERRLNAGEVFDACRNNALFAAQTDDVVFNMVVKSYERWNIAQHKIHASPIAPTFGSNVDHQTSLRTPNLNGGSRDEVVGLAIRLVIEALAARGIETPEALQQKLGRRAWQDNDFMAAVERKIRIQAANQDFSLKPLIDEIAELGWQNVLPEVSKRHATDLILK